MGFDWICLVDFGGQYTHLIQRNLNELTTSRVIKVSPRRFRNLHEIRGGGLKAIILSGGPGTHKNRKRHKKSWLSETLARFTCPILGICYGYQTIGCLMGAKVGPCSNQAEYGQTPIQVLRDTHCKLFDGVPNETKVWMSHMDWVDWSMVRDDVHVLAKTDNGVTCAIYVPKRKLYGVQFHPEVHHTTCGQLILGNFLSISGCLNQKPITEDIIQNTLVAILAEVKSKVHSPEQVLLAVSGGVDSTVVAALLAKALGRAQLHCVFIDTGLLRKNDVQNVKQLFREHLDIPLTVIKEEFFDILKGITDPEEKRRLIGYKFGMLFQTYAEQHPKIKWMAQGTIYPDRVESGQAGHGSHCIKTHHNLSLPDKFGLRVLEPIRNLYKDQVRTLGTSLGIPSEVVHQQPFPGPGLAVRVLGEVTRERVEMVRKADDILNRTLKEMEPAWYKEQVWQCFVALFATTNTVGVKGDQRSYEHPMAIRVVQSRDAMTARVACPPSIDSLLRIANMIVNQVPGCNRVMLDLTTKPPGTIEYE